MCCKICNKLCLGGSLRGSIEKEGNIQKDEQISGKKGKCVCFG